ncbi:MAG: hypothetical protein ACOCXJ_01725 [Planctomycetota bacterium]
MDAGSGAQEEEEELVMAMPRRELFAVRGFSRTMQLPVLDSLNQEHWFALPTVLEEDIDAKEVRIALLVCRDHQWLVEESGVLLHAAPVCAGVVAFGSGLAGLKQLARAAGAELVGSTRVRIELYGYLNEDRLEETRPYFILVYLLRVPEETAAPAGMSWIGARHLRDLTLDPASSLVADVCADV